MPEMDFQRYTYGNRRKKRRRNKSNNTSFIASILPWKGDAASEAARKVVFLVSIFVLIFAVVMIVGFYFGEKEDDVQDPLKYVINHDDTAVEEIDAALLNYPAVTAAANNDNASGNTDDNPANPANPEDKAPKAVVILSKYKEFWEENNEFVGFLSIGDLINYPVAQVQDDKPIGYYLHHAFDGRPTENGSIFANEYREEDGNAFTPDSRPHNTIIHGHHLKNGGGFKPLDNYLDSARTGLSGFEFLKKNPIIRFDTLHEQGEYKIFSVYQTNTDEVYGDFYKYWNKNTFETQDDFYEYVTEALDRSRYHTNVDLKYGDELLTLTTCDFSMFSEIRLVIVARRVRPDEGTYMNTDEFINYREEILPYFPGRDEEGFMRYKMFDAFYLGLNNKKGWAGRKWDVSLVEGLYDYLYRISGSE